VPQTIAQKAQGKAVYAEGTLTAVNDVVGPVRLPAGEFQLGANSGWVGTILIEYRRRSFRSVAAGTWITLKSLTNTDLIGDGKCITSVSAQIEWRFTVTALASGTIAFLVLGGG
jgi:hypothetical protein